MDARHSWMYTQVHEHPLYKCVHIHMNTHTQQLERRKGHLENLILLDQKHPLSNASATDLEVSCSLS